MNAQTQGEQGIRNDLERFEQMVILRLFYCSVPLHALSLAEGNTQRRQNGANAAFSAEEGMLYF